RAVKRAGGISVVQDPKDAEFSEMPLTALNRAQPDHVVRLADMPALLNGLVHQQAGEAKPVPPSLKFEVEIAQEGDAAAWTTISASIVAVRDESVKRARSPLGGKATQQR